MRTINNWKPKKELYIWYYSNYKKTKYNIYICNIIKEIFEKKDSE
jgi:hypothetical protein